MKAVVLKDGKIIGKAKCLSGGIRIAESAEKAWDGALKDADVSAADVAGIAATGKGKYDVNLADKVCTEMRAAVTAARFLVPAVTTVVDIGADETVVATVKPDGTVGQTLLNQKCAAGLGTFLKSMAWHLELPLEEMSALNVADSHSQEGVAVNDGCVVFAEMDALGLLNRGVAPKDVAAAITKAAAVRANTTLNDVTVPMNDCVVLFGGMTQNDAFIAAWKELSGIDFVIPGDAEYGGALGASLMAASLMTADAPN
jgi:benzoyl-CoA reductase subunit D